MGPRCGAGAGRASESDTSLFVVATPQTRLLPFWASSQPEQCPKTLESSKRLRTHRRASYGQCYPSQAPASGGPRGTGLPQGSLEGPQEDVEDGTGGSGPMVEEGPEALGGPRAITHSWLSEKCGCS